MLQFGDQLLFPVESTVSVAKDNASKVLGSAQSHESADSLFECAGIDGQVVMDTLVDKWQAHALKSRAVR
jgi:hypothetical protein